MPMACLVHCWLPGHNKRQKATPRPGNHQQTFSMSPPFLFLFLLVILLATFPNRQGCLWEENNSFWKKRNCFGIGQLENNARQLCHCGHRLWVSEHRTYLMSLCMHLDLLLPLCWEQIWAGFHSYLLLLLYSPADAGLLQNQHSQKGLGAAFEVSFPFFSYTEVLLISSLCLSCHNHNSHVMIKSLSLLFEDGY